MHRHVKGRGYKKAQEAVTQVRRRQSDARWRANVASCFETLKQVIPVNMRASKRQISKASVLHETQKHINFLETTLCSLLQAKAKYLNQKDDKTLHVTPKEMLIDIQQDFINKQHESVAALKEKKHKSQRTKMGLPHHSFIKRNMDTTQFNTSPKISRNRGRCQDRQISPRTFAARLLRQQLETSEKNCKEEDEFDANAESQEDDFLASELKIDETKNEDESKPTKHQPQHHVGKRIYELSPDREAERINTAGDPGKVFDQVDDFIKSEKTDDLKSLYNQSPPKLLNDDNQLPVPEFEEVKKELKEEWPVQTKTDESHDQFVPEQMEKTKQTTKKPKFISLKYVGSLVPDQFDRRCIQKVTSCPVLGRVIVLAPGSQENITPLLDQDLVRDSSRNQFELLDQSILASFKTKSAQVQGHMEGRKVLKSNSDHSLFFNGQSVVEVNVKTSQSEYLSVKFDDSDPVRMQSDLKEASDKVDPSYYSPLSSKELELPSYADESNGDSSSYFCEIKSKPKGVNLEFDATVSDDANQGWWSGLENPLHLPEDPNSVCGLEAAPCPTPCPLTSPSKLFASSSDLRMDNFEKSWSMSLEDEIRHCLIQQPGVLKSPKNGGKKKQVIDPATSHVVPDLQIQKLDETTTTEHNLEVPNSVITSQECLTAQATPLKTPKKPRVVFTPQSACKRYRTPNRERTASTSPARLPCSEFSTPGKRLHSPDRSPRNNALMSTPAHKRDRRPLVENNTMTPCKLTSLITPTRRPLMSYDSTPNKSTQSPSGSSLGFTPVRLPYDHTPTSPFSPFNSARRRNESQSDWETESLRCDEDDICSDDEEEIENQTPKSRGQHRSSKKHDLKGKSRTVPHRGRRERAPRGHPRCDSESSVRTLSSARPSSEKRRSRLSNNKKSENGPTPKCCRFLDLTHVDEDLEKKNQHNYSKPYQVSEYFDLHDQPDDFDRYLEEYQAAVDKSIRASPGESDTTWSADEGDPIPSHINLIWQELMASHTNNTKPGMDAEKKSEVMPGAWNCHTADVPSPVPNMKNSYVPSTPAQVVPMLPDVTEPYNYLSISLTADGSLASSGDLSDDLKDIDIQPIVPDLLTGSSASDNGLERIFKLELNVPQEHEAGGLCSSDRTVASEKIILHTPSVV